MDIQEILGGRFLPGAIVALLGSILLSAIKSAVSESSKIVVAALRDRYAPNRDEVVVVQITCDGQGDLGNKVM